MSSLARDQVAPALDLILDAQAENDLQTHALYDPAHTSVFTRVAALRKYGVPPHELRAILDEIVVVLASNQRERDNERGCAGILDRLTADAQAAGVRSAITVRGLANALRPLLREQNDENASARILAAHEIHALAREFGRSKLLAPSMRSQLGRGPFSVLVDVLNTELVASVPA